MVMGVAKYGNAGGKDLLLSVLAFGVYAFVKSSKMDQKRTAIDAAIRDLISGSNTIWAQTVFSVEADGQMLAFRRSALLAILL
ncbi:hypothetical protein [Paraburkholderia sp. RL17-373-BIF-A]|uniref:hypothetical protein n=1 Tax=Paraburkholderia sp. RL17-373-BIF-A TaxID=3031629 RepID=UPI0038BC6AA5